LKAKCKFISNDLFIGLFLVILAGIFLIQALQFPGNSVYFPSIALLLLLGLSIFMTGIGIYKTWRVRQGKAVYKNPEVKKRSYLIFLSIIVYIFFLNIIGFFVSSAIYLPCGMLLFGQRNPKSIILATIGLLAFLYWLFVIQLKVYMPDGLLF
jgi:hypothetical protein